MRRDIVRQAVTVLAVVATIAVNYAATALPLNGLTTGELADRFPVEIQPAGYAFSIWSLIYLGLAAFAVYQALPAQRTDPLLRRLGYLPAATAIFNIAWILLWHYEFASLSLVAMLGLFGVLIATLRRLPARDAGLSGAQRLLVAAPFGAYAGWITAASAVNVGVLIYDQSRATWESAPLLWTLTLLAIATAVAVAVGLRRANIAYTLVFLWAAAGVAVANLADPLIVSAAAVAALLALAAFAFGRMRPAAMPARTASAAR